MNRPRLLGWLAAILALALDQASKYAVVHALGDSEPVARPMAPFLDLVLRWNKGISFSLLRQDTPLGVALLLGFTLLVVALLGIWLMRAPTRVVAVGLGLIIGGALGNAVDRIGYGAVVDFLDLHALGRHFFVFNIADSAISLGVALLLLDGLFARPRVA